MKKGLLIILGMFMMVSTVEAKSGDITTIKNGVNNIYENSVNFIERDIKFHVFLNGEFDFNTNFGNTTTSYYYRGNHNNGVRIERDFNGRIRRVGNVFVNYDFRGNVTRIGNVFMRYSFGNLTNVGGLRITYDRWGHPRFYGHVKANRYNNYYNSGFNSNANFGDICDYNDAYFYRPDFRNNYTKFKEDNNYFYYRAKPNTKTGRSSILRRKKPSTSSSTTKPPIRKPITVKPTKRKTYYNNKRS